MKKDKKITNKTHADLAKEYNKLAIFSKIKTGNVILSRKQKEEPITLE